MFPFGLKLNSAFSPTQRLLSETPAEPKKPCCFFLSTEKYLSRGLPAISGFEVKNQKQKSPQQVTWN